MPELPEVETTCRGIAPHITGARVDKAELRDGRLRWQVPGSIVKTLTGQSVQSVGRRGKYILINFNAGCLMIHLGMSGSLRLVPLTTPAQKHEHFDLCFDTGLILRYRDIRRFGSIHWLTDAPETHALLKDLGPEPLSGDFTGEHLYNKTRNRTQAIKPFIMDSHIVVGVGNIYANEALFESGILPGTRSGRLSKKRCDKLVRAIKKVLKKAILKGGTTLRDFLGADGKPGYFKQTLKVYDRQGLPCRACHQPLRSRVIGQRATYYCCYCQH